MNEIHVYTDGGSEGNPGLSAIGVVICIDQSTKKFMVFSEERRKIL